MIRAACNGTQKKTAAKTKSAAVAAAKINVVFYSCAGIRAP